MGDSVTRTRVAVSECADYAPENVQAAVDSIFASIGGLETVISAGQSVLIKPNLLTDREPERAVTTHPEVARAVIRAVKAVGGVPSVADSPCNVVKIEKVWEKTGFLAMCGEEGVPLVNLEKSGSVVYDVDGIKFTVAQPIMDADVLITLPKVKTHVLTTYTGAIKNLYGTIPGFQKTNLHKEYPTQADFGRLITALYSKVTPHLALADGVIGMEGEGPSSGGDPVKLGFLAGSFDAVALDTVICDLLRIKFKAVPYLPPIRAAGLGQTNMSEIDVIGEPPANLASLPYRVPSTVLTRLIPRWLVNVIKPYVWIRPSFTERCITCGRCIKACPADALTMGENKRPVLEFSKCIECCCCHEVCPERAVDMTMSPFMNFFRRGRLP